LAVKETAIAAPRAARAEAALPIPPLIKRNTLYLALSQSMTGAGTHMAYALGSLMVVSLLGNATLMGLSVTLIGLSRFMVAYAIGKITDVYGRKPGMLVGLMLAMVGGLMLGSSMFARSFPLFVVAMLVFAMGMNAAQQLRVAATDMYPPSRRAEGLGYVLTGSVLGAFGGPILVTTAETLSHHLDADPLGMPWMFLPIVIIPSMFVVSLVKPDPKDIAANLEKYYPGYQPERRARARGNASIWSILKQFTLMTAIASNFSAQGTMAIVMVTTSLALAHQGHDLPEISVSQALHTIGMFGFSVPVGKLADRFGRRSILLPGVLIVALGGILVVTTQSYWTITLGAFLVGVGWCCSNVAATAMIADATQPHERGRAIGLNDTIASGGNIVLPLMAGIMAESFGMPILAIVSLILMAGPLTMLLTLRESRHAAATA
jgi:MFS family permease